MGVKEEVIKEEEEDVVEEYREGKEGVGMRGDQVKEGTGRGGGGDKYFL